MLTALSKLTSIPLKPGTILKRPIFDLQDSTQPEDIEKGICGMLTTLSDLAMDDDNCHGMGDYEPLIPFFVKFLFKTNNEKYRALLIRLISEFIGSEYRWSITIYRVIEFFFEYAVVDRSVDLWLPAMKNDGLGFISVPCHMLFLATKALAAFTRIEPHKTKFNNLGIISRIQQLKETVKDPRAEKTLKTMEQDVKNSYTMIEGCCCYHCFVHSQRSTLKKCSQCHTATYCSKLKCFLLTICTMSINCCTRECQIADWRDGHREECERYQNERT